MPLLKFHLLKGRPDQEITRLLDTAHGAVVRSFQVPTRDIYQIVTEYDATHLRALDTGLGIDRSDKFALLEVV